MHALQISLWAVVLLVVLVIIFDFMNGFHDAANSVATVVLTGVFKSQQAVAIAAAYNVITVSIFHLKMATTVGRDTINLSTVDHYVVFGTLVGTIAWNIVMWYYDIPSSSPHALVGGLVGMAVVKPGAGSLVANGLFRTVASILTFPLLGFTLGSLLMVAVSWLFFRMPPSKIGRWFRCLQLFLALLYSLGHGGDDTQRIISIIWMLLTAGGYVSATATKSPIWVIVRCYVAVSLGTLLGGWRVVRTMGQKITKLEPAGGFCAETGSAMTLFFTSTLGVPMSTTHTITGVIVGTGAA